MKKKAKKIFSILMVVGMLFQILVPTMVYAETYNGFYQVTLGGAPTIDGSTFEYTHGNVTITKNGLSVTTNLFEVVQNDEIVITFIPDAGYKAKLYNAFNGSNIVLDGNTYSFTIGTVAAATLTLTPSFELIPVTTYSVGYIEPMYPNGRFTVDKTSATSGETITISSITPNTGYQLKGIKIFNGSIDLDITSAVNYNYTNNTFTMPDYDVIVSVEFEKIPYTITVNDVEGATITPNGTINVEYGDNKEITIKAKDGYKLTKVKVDGVEQTLPLTNDKITLTNIQKDITIIVECELLYEEKTITKTEEDITVIVKGQFNGNPTLVITSTEAGNEGYNSLITLVKDDEVVFGSYDVSITGGTYKGELAMTFTIGKQYEGDTITIYHKLANGEIETKTTTVKDGKIIITVDELSPFMLITDKEIVEQKDETPKTGTIEYIGITTLIITISVLEISILKRKEA
ncbi:MAG: hypothetical protein PHD15_06665 [Clostridia bacterium]|nr:hypothetical protein [Clostridia bacterium]